MSNADSSFEENEFFEESEEENKFNELSEEDRAVLQAFDAMAAWPAQHDTAAEISSVTPETSDADTVTGRTTERHANQDTEVVEADDEDVDDMLLLFASEVDEDIATLQRVLQQLEQDDRLNAVHFVALKRTAHKIRGTSGAVECHAMAKIAHVIEIIVDEITRGTVFPVVGINALVHAVLALEQTLVGVVSTRQESEAPLYELETLCESLSIPLQPSSPSSTGDIGTFNSLFLSPKEADLLMEGDTVPVRIVKPTVEAAQESQFQAGGSERSDSVERVDARRLAQLVCNSEQLVELRTPVENALLQVEAAVMELNAAQARLEQLEASLMLFPVTAKSARTLYDEHPTSSLIARILNEASQRDEERYPRKRRSRLRLVKAGGALPWDELELERYSERDMLTCSFNEALADMSTATAQMRTAFAHLRSMLQTYMAQATTVRSDTLQLRSAPLSVLIPRLQRALKLSTPTQEQHIHFEVAGDTLEIDQGLLEPLTAILLQLLRTCITDIYETELDSSQHIWLHAQSIGSELAIELGFSMTIHGGALDAVRESVRRLNGSISLQINTAGGVSFHLRLPRSQGTVHCLLVQSGNQHLLVPFSQVQRIVDGLRDSCDLLFTLSDLLALAPGESATPRIDPTLLLPQGVSRRTVGIAVGEVIGDVELVVKPLAPYLQRPGLSGVAIDGAGHVLLVLDLPELVRYYIDSHRDLIGEEGQRDKHGNMQQIRNPKILIADDSAYLRQSLTQTMQHANGNYTVVEARDGMEALAHLVEDPPDVFLLDMEMPNLNGYDLLEIMRLYPELANVKVVVLTSRSSEKHRQHALDLGAHVYLTKPCNQEVLIETVRMLLQP